MHLPHLSPTGLVGTTSSGDSMDDDSSSSVMGYGNPYLASGMSREIGNNLTQDPDAAYRYVGKLNAQQRDSNGWKMDKLCDGRSYDNPVLVNWLAEDEEEQVPETVGEASTEGEEEMDEGGEKHNSEDILNTDDEKYSTEEDAKYVEDFDSSTEEGTEGDSCEDEDEGEAGGQDTFLPEADDYLAPTFMDSKGHEQELQPRRKLQWDGREGENLNQGDHWQGNNSTVTKSSPIESERYGKKSTEASPNTSGTSLRPVLCFDEYGNLTTCQEVVEPEVPPLFTSPPPVSAINKKWGSPVDTPVQEAKVLRSRNRTSLENRESPPPAVSEQELQQAFKEEFNTAATSRYGRTRKRKTADGFLFGTINFNELRRITSGSPRKNNKSTTPKNTSPDLKAKTKEDKEQSFILNIETKDVMDLNENGFRSLDGHPINGEAEVTLPPQGIVQMDQAKDSTHKVQSRDTRTRERKAARRRCSTAPKPSPPQPLLPSPSLPTAATDMSSTMVEKETASQEGSEEETKSTTISEESLDRNTAATIQEERPPQPRTRHQKRNRSRARNRVRTSFDISEETPPTRRSTRLSAPLTDQELLFLPARRITRDHPVKEKNSINQPGEEVTSNEQSEKEVTSNDQPGKELTNNEQPEKEVTSNDQPGKELTSNDQPAKEVTSNHQPEKELTSNNQPVKEVTGIEQTEKEMTGNDQPVKEMMSVDQAEKEVTDDDKSKKEVTNLDKPVKDETSNDQPVKEDTSNDQSGKEVTSNDQSEKEVTSNDQSGKEVTSNDRPEKEVTVTDDQPAKEDVTNNDQAVKTEEEKLVKEEVQEAVTSNKEKESMKEEVSAKEEEVTVKKEVGMQQDPAEGSQVRESVAAVECNSECEEATTASVTSDSQDDSGDKTEDEKASSITKSGRVVKKPQLMDISDEAKRQKQTREQLRQNEALMNSSIEEELSLSSVSRQVLVEKEHPCQYMVGDLVWVHIRGSPLWPSMISYDPMLGQYSKVVTKVSYMLKYSGIRMYHVQFFSDNSQTQWIAPNSIVPYEGYDKLKEYLLDLKAKVKINTRKNRRSQFEGVLKTLLHIKKVASGHKRERWMTAISEANMAMEMDRYERIQKYTIKPEDDDSDDADTNAKQSSRGSQGRTAQGQSEKKKRGRPKKPSGEVDSKTDGDYKNSEFSGFDNMSGEGNKQKRVSLTSRMHRQKAESYAKEHLEDFLQENPGMSKEAAMKKLRWRWRKLTSAQGGRFKGAGGKRKHQRGGDSSNEWEDEEGSSGGSGSSKRQRLEEEAGRGVYKVVRNEKVCCRCEGVTVRSGADMVRCKGLCCGVFHLGCLGLTTMPRRDFKCEECLTERHPCFICKSLVGPVQRCSVPFCGKFYHDACIQRWPQVSRHRQQEKFVCPRHVCHMCAANADDVADSLARIPPFTRCLRCPTTYHTGEVCIAAGTEEISQSSHICTKHLQLPKNLSHHVNVNWCFCCSKGGSLLLCDQCPAAFHADCMKITTPEGGYVCEDCENGKFPVYGDVVWVKLGLYRWWPGQVLHPRFIPDNIENLPHQQGMFCVHFFGSNDYYWVTRGRAFLYQEGDKGSKAHTSRTLEVQFRRAVAEALEAYNEQKSKRNLQERRWSEKGNLKPPPYIRIDTNRPVGNVRLNKVDLAAINRCDCEPNSDNPCGSDGKCLNRMLMFECVREVCGAGDRCGNQRFQKKIYPSVGCFKTEDRGWGLKATQEIKKGEFVIEYVGELIDDEEFRRRILEMHDVKEENYYFLTIDKDIMIDAGPKGNLARFMNHSCQPNCETQKWTVGGDTRVGLFAIEDIPEGAELTFNYNLQCVGTEKKRCCCGAPNCSGFIGVKVQKTEAVGPKREKNGKHRRKKRRREVKLSEDECFRCGESGALILCDGTGCPKGYHLECLGLDKLPRGKWICPWHHCDECGLLSTRSSRCDYCPNSYCRQHLLDNLRHIHGLGNVCQDHDAEELEALKGQIESTPDNENTATQEQQKSDMDSDCGQSSLSHTSPSLEVEAQQQNTATTVKEEKQKSDECPSTNKQVRKVKVIRRPRRRSAQVRSLQRRRNRKMKMLNSLTRRNGVNGLIVPDKERTTKQTEEKAKHVNEA